MAVSLLKGISVQQTVIAFFGCLFFAMIISIHTCTYITYTHTQMWWKNRPAFYVYVTKYSVSMWFGQAKEEKVLSISYDKTLCDVLWFSISCRLAWPECQFLIHKNWCGNSQASNLSLGLSLCIRTWGNAVSLGFSKDDGKKLPIFSCTSPE